MTTASLLDRVLGPIGRSLTIDVAREIVQFRADDETQRRIDELAEKNTEGTLTAEEHDEYAEYVAAFNIITNLQAHARSVIDGTNGR